MLVLNALIDFMSPVSPLEKGECRPQAQDKLIEISH